MAPLPSPGNVVRCHLQWGPSSTNIWGSRFYLKYTGGPPTTADLNTFCSNVRSHYVATLLAYMQNNLFLQEVAALDLSSDTGNEGVYSGSDEGTNGSGATPEDACILVNFQIPRHYRGGHPKMFLPPAASTHLSNENQWDSATVTGVQSAWGTFISDILADTYSSMVLSDNCNISYYNGFTPFKMPSGRYRNIPTPRVTPLVDLISGHTVRPLIGSQRRRRTSVSG